MARPEDPELDLGLAGIRAAQGLKHLIDFVVRPPFLEDPPGVSGVPLVGVGLHPDQSRIVEFPEVLWRGLRLAVTDLEDAAVRAVVGIHLVVVALVLVVPVDHVHAAVRPVLEVDDLRPGVVGKQEVRRMRAQETGAARREDVPVDPRAVDVVHEQRSAILRRPGIAEVDHRPGMGMAAPRRVRTTIAAVGRESEIMTMIGDGLDILIRVGIEVQAGLTLVAAPLRDVVEVRDHAGGDDHLATGIEVDAPRIARTMGEDLEDMSGRVVTPDPGIDRGAPCLGRPGLADSRVSEDPVAAVKPAVGAAGEGVERLVGIVLAPAVEQDLRRAVGPVVAIAVGYEQELRRRADPDTAESDGQSAHEVQVIDEDLAPVESAVAVGVLEDEDAVPGLGVGHAARVRISLGDPDPASIVDRHRDRLDDVGLAGK
jgi:hypothetical protein